MVFELKCLALLIVYHSCQGRMIETKLYPEMLKKKAKEKLEREIVILIIDDPWLNDQYSLISEFISHS